MKRFDAEVQDIWDTVDIEEKRVKLLQLVDKFQYTHKAGGFKMRIRGLKSGEQMDILAKNIVLADMKVLNQ